MNYIGMDTSIASLDFAVVDERGTIKKRDKIPTSEIGLIKFIRSIPKPRILYLEEGSLASWVVEVCHRHGEEAIVMDPKQNKWIANGDQKNDPLDALKIAELARGKFYKEIHHAIGHRKRFRELMLYYHDTVRTQARLKNIIKAKFRQYGIHCTGKTIFMEEYQENWFSKLNKEPQMQWTIKHLLEQHKCVENIVDAIRKKVKEQAKTYSEIKLFRDLPGIDWINAATFSALIENPFRFATKKKLWTYAGVGVSKKESSKRVYTEGANLNFNRNLKYTLNQAAQVAIMAKDSYFHQKYIYLTLNGITPKRAFLHICRNMLTIIWTLWKTGKPYREENFAIKKIA